MVAGTSSAFTTLSFHSALMLRLDSEKDGSWYTLPQYVSSLAAYVTYWL